MIQVGWIGTAFLMMKTQIGLGVLSIPVVFETLGMIPGVICLLVIATITTWSDYVVGVFKFKHPEVYGIDDVGRLVAGSPGYWIMGGAFCLCKESLSGEKNAADWTLIRFHLPVRVRYA